MTDRCKYFCIDGVVRVNNPDMDTGELTDSWSKWWCPNHWPHAVGDPDDITRNREILDRALAKGLIREVVYEGDLVGIPVYSHLGIARDEIQVGSRPEQREDERAGCLICGADHPPGAPHRPGEITRLLSRLQEVERERDDLVERCARCGSLTDQQAQTHLLAADDFYRLRSRLQEVEREAKQWEREHREHLAVCDASDFEHAAAIKEKLEAAEQRVAELEQGLARLWPPENGQLGEAEHMGDVERILRSLLFDCDECRGTGRDAFDQPCAYCTGTGKALNA